MILYLFIGIPLLGGILALITERWSRSVTRWISLIALFVNFVFALWLWIQYDETLAVTTTSWFMERELPWIPSFGINFHLAIDGLSLLMVLLTSFLGILSVITSWEEIQYRIGFFHFNLLWVLAGITGVFLTVDLFLFYFFWEVMLIPMFLLINIWGHENRRYAAYKFFIFTQASGLLMFLSILGLYFLHGDATGTYTFDYFELLGTELSPEAGRLLMLGFLIAFIVKLPAVPFHSWLPDAHAQAPTAGSVILAGLLLKTGAYGILRFVIPLFPDAAHEIAPWAMLLGVLGILYGAILAFSQTDFKRLVAYTSVSHMGFVMLGAFAFNSVALQGVVMQMITHGISTGALFILAGSVYERIHTRDIQQMGGFWAKMPFMGSVGLVFAMASLGLPGLGNFIAEFLTLIGAWQASHKLTILATIGLVIATVYSLRIMQKVFYGTEEKVRPVLFDLSVREKLIFIPLVVVIIWLGLYPQPVLNTTTQFISEIYNPSSINKPKIDRHVVTKNEIIEIDKKGGSHE